LKNEQAEFDVGLAAELFKSLKEARSLITLSEIKIRLKGP
jgi:hypothetical protein